MIKKILLDFVSSLILGLGFIIMVSPILINLYIHGNYERYKWVLSGPYPFNSFGSGPFQLWMGSKLFTIGFILIVVALLIRIFIKRI